MKLAQLYWNGSFDSFMQGIVEHCPLVLRAPAQVAAKAIRRANTPIEGVEGFAADAAVNFYRAHNVSEEISTVAIEAAERAETAMERLMEVVDKFRSNTKNDLASMKASSDRVQQEVDHMVVRYNAAVQMLTAPEFERAVANAERMVAAMQAMHALQTTKVSLAIFGDADLEVRNGG